MDLGLKDKVAVITGAVGGMGEESARILADEGVKVVLADIRDEDGEALAEEIAVSRATSSMFMSMSR